MATKEERKRSIWWRLAGMAIAISFIYFMINYYYHDPLPEKCIPTFSFLAALLLVTGIGIVIAQLASRYIFDNREDTKNDSVDALVEKLRFRGLLFDNIAVAIFAVIVLVILVGFYLLVDPQANLISQRIPSGNPQVKQSVMEISDLLAIRIGATVLLIFLVQILFRVFKYLLRIACFYNGIADTIEFSQMEEFKNLDPRVDFLKLLESITPEKYDISDLPQVSLTDILKSGIPKGK